jgi:hypothetical protein
MIEKYFQKNQNLVKEDTRESVEISYFIQTEDQLFNRHVLKLPPCCGMID